MKGKNQSVLVSERTSTGRLYLPVLLRAVTSTTSFFICIELWNSSLYEATLIALEYGNKSS